MKEHKDWIVRYFSEHEDDEEDGVILQELVRCKDCEHLKVSGELEHTNGDTTFYYICDYWHRGTDEWRYCDQGTRRKEEDDD